MLELFFEIRLLSAQDLCKMEPINIPAQKDR